MGDVKVLEAKFFFDQLSAAEMPLKHFRCYLTAFLQSSHSVPEWLLYEYAVKYLHLSRDDYIKTESFRLAAKALAAAHQDDEALRFYRWWEGATRTLHNSEAGRVLTEKRHLVTHRGRPAFSVRVFAPEFLTDQSFIVSTDSFMVPAVEDDNFNVSTDMIRFSDHPNRTVVDYCRDYLANLARYVDSAYLEFPRN